VAALAAGGAAAVSGASWRGAADRIVVFKAGVDVDARTQTLERALGFSARFRYHAALPGFAARLTAAQVAALEHDAAVAFVSDDRPVEAADALQAGETVPTGVGRIAAATSSSAEGAASVAVAVIDTGIDLAHPDLNAAAGKNCVSSTSPPQDDNGHGTHVAGTIAAKNTGSGVVGVAPGTTVYAVKVLNRNGSGTWSQVICGIDWVTANAASRNIRVASMSLGGSGTNDGNCGLSNADALHRAICNSVAAGVSYVVAAGNSGASFASFVPAAYPEVVTVTAFSDSDGAPGGLGGAPSCRTGEKDDWYASFSNYAPSSDAVAEGHTIAAPGVCILSDWPGGGTAVLSGTSMATPHVSGSVALCISAGACTAGASPGLTIAAIDNSDPSTGFVGDPSSALSGRYYGYTAWDGLLQQPPAATAPGAPTLDSAAAGDATVTLQWTAPASDGGSALTGYKIYRGTTAGGEAYLTSVSSTATSYADGGLSNGTTYYYRVSAVNGVGESSLSNELSATPQAASATVPGAPLNLAAAPANGRGVQLSWQPPASDGGSAVSAYRVYRGTDGATTPSALIASVGGLSYKDTATTRGTVYYYVVRAVNAVGEGAASNVASAQAR
jgi:subtilisin